MTFQYDECEVLLQSPLEGQLVHWLAEGWEVIGLHRKQRRKRSVVVAIMRRPCEAPRGLAERVPA